MTSIRSFLITLLLATIVLIIFLSVLQGYEASNKEIQQQMDARLVDMAKLLSNLHVSDYVAHEVINAGSNFAFQIVSSQGDILYYSSMMAKKNIISLKQEFNEMNFNGYRWRSFTFFNSEAGIWVVVAERIDIRFKLSEKILLKSLMPIVLGIPIAALLIWFVIGHALKPLHRLSDVLKNKREDDLSPLEIRQPFMEVEYVIQSSNSLLKRLRLSFEREKRFASDVAHELRTPLSILKIDLFNLTQELSDNNKNSLVLNKGIDRMEHLVQQILTLYRTTPDQFMTTFVSVDLALLAQNLIAEFYDIFDKKSQSITLEGGSCLLQGDQSTLKILLLNLIGNANKYTPEGGAIKVSVSEQDKSIILRVEDSGIGIDESEYERVFDRFYRINSASYRSREIGSGIGLSIVKHIVELHKATIQLKKSTFKTGLMISIELPKGDIDV